MRNPAEGLPLPTCLKNPVCSGDAGEHVAPMEPPAAAVAAAAAAAQVCYVLGVAQLLGHRSSLFFPLLTFADMCHAI